MNKKEGALSKTMIFYVSTLSFIFGLSLISFLRRLSFVSEFYYFGLLLFFISLFVLLKNKKIRIAILIAIFLFLGLWRYSLNISDINLDNYFSDTKKITLKGTVSSDIVRKNNKQKFEFIISAVQVDDWQELESKVLVYSLAYPIYYYGDELLLVCKLKEPEAFEGFAYDRYLARHNIYSICYYPGIKKLNTKKANSFITFSFYLKNKIRSIIDRGLGEPEASLTRAIILGDGSLIDDDLRFSFSRSGISHIVAISGLHIGIIAVMISFFLFKIGLSRNLVFYFSIFCLSFFIFLVGMPASAVRAGLMVVLAMYALKIGRTSQPERIIILVACVLLFINPKLLRDDIGFQLSFTAVLGIIYIFPIIKVYLEKIKITNYYKIRDVLGVTIAAQIATGPIAAFYFGVLPILGIVANLLVLWTLPFLIGSIILAIFLSFIFKVFIVYIFFIPMLILDYIILISNLVNKLPFAYFELKLSIVSVLIYYLLLILFVFLGNNKTKKIS